MRELEEREKAEPKAVKALHAAWTALLAEARAHGDREEVRERLERLESAANREYRELYRPVQEKVRDLLGSRKPREAQKVLREWKVPEAVDLSGTFAADVRRELEAIDALVACEEARAKLEADYRAGRYDADAGAVLEKFVASPHLAVRAEAERALPELRTLRGLGLLRRRLEDRKGRGAARVEEVRREIARDAAAEKERTAAWERRLRESTGKKPIPIRQLGVDLDASVSVRKLDARQVTFGGPGFETSFGIDQVPTALYGQLLQAAPDPADARDLLEAGKLAVRRGVLDVAASLFEQAVRVDPSAAELVPDLARIRRGMTSFHGAAALSGDRLALSYDFGSGDQRKDFSLSAGAEFGKEPTGLSIEGEGLFYGGLSNVKFRGRAKVTCEPASLRGETGFIVGATFEVAPGESDALVLLLEPARGFRVARLPKRGSAQILAEGAAPPRGAVEVEFQSPKVEVRSAGSPLWSGSLGAFTELLPIVGGNVFGDGAGGATFRAVRIEGRVSPSWAQRLQSERLTILEAELSRERRTTREERAAEPVSGGPEFGDDPLHPIALEAELRPLAPVRVAEQVARARSATALLEKARTVDEFWTLATQVQQHLDEAVREAPWYPLSWYYRAEWEYWLDRPARALADLSEAVAREGAFVEARVARAGLLLELSRYAEAEQELGQALGAVPDLAPARLARALLCYYGGREAEAISELEVARRLDPSDLFLRRSAKRLRNIVAGPRWPESVVVETPNYTIKAEAPRPAGRGKKEDPAKSVRQRLERYAEHLDASRRWFAEIFPGRPSRARKPLVYIFDSPEGYYVYADFTQEDRLEHTAGVYLGAYQQMLFYRGESEEETLETMTHEAFHEYLASVAPAAPVWLNEGLAEYSAGIAVRGGRVAESGLVIRDRLRVLQAALDRGWEGFPFQVVMLESQEQFYAVSPELQYAQAWSMVHFFRHGAGGRHKPVFERYVRAVAAGRSGEEALAETFAGADWKALRQEWQGYVRSLR
jgi:tetratricopeptide (TPR) repeat protein